MHKNVVLNNISYIVIIIKHIIFDLVNYILFKIKCVLNIHFTSYTKWVLKLTTNVDFINYFFSYD